MFPRVFRLIFNRFYVRKICATQLDPIQYSMAGIRAILSYFIASLQILFKLDMISQNRVYSRLFESNQVCPSQSEWIPVTESRSVSIGVDSEQSIRSATTTTQQFRSRKSIYKVKKLRNRPGLVYAPQFCLFQNDNDGKIKYAIETVTAFPFPEIGRLKSGRFLM